MDLVEGRRDIVDPEVRAYVSSLVTALGGSGADEDGRYVLGDDALACLRDLKRWLKLYDDKSNRLDVARCLAEANLLGGDLLQILAAWPEHATEEKLKAKTALACVELMVPLTWPLDKDPVQMTENHHIHIPYLQIAQLGYKRSVINFDGARILHTVVRCALPSIAKSLNERTSRDEGIFKLVLYFIRNIAMIAPPPNFQYDGDEAEISRSSTIDAFDYQDIFHLLLAVSSMMGEDFDTQDVIILEILFHLVKGVDVEKLFWDKKQIDDRNINELKRLREKEAAILRSYQANAPTRHNRFGTMAWMQREDAKMTTITGQTAVMDGSRSLAKMDSTKKYKPPRRAIKGENGPLQFDIPVELSTQAQKHLRKFVEDFLDSGFNPLFNHLRRAIDRESERVTEYHPRQFFYLVSWFLKAERIRIASQIKISKAQQPKDLDELDGFSLVASVLNQEMFVTLNRIMSSTFEQKSWSDLSAVLRCFTQILLTVLAMSESPLEEDREIAENILIRIFYEETTHDRIASITRSYKDQGFGYLDSITECTHNYLRILERYCKENTDLQVRSKKSHYKKKTVGLDGNAENDDSEDSGENNALMTERTLHERKFDFKRFSSRFVVQGCVDTFVAFTTYYNDLNSEQLKRAHRFFYRVSFKHDISVMLFRVDIIALLHKMIKGPNSLDTQSSAFKEWEELVRQILKKCIRKVQERPELVVEMLFSKTNSIAYFLEYGQEKQTSTKKPRSAAELTVKGNKELDEQIYIVVTAILDKYEQDHLVWLKSQISSVESERRSWEAANKALPSIEKDSENLETPLPLIDNENPKPPSILVKADNTSRENAMFKNGFLRLLMNLVGFQHTGDENDPEAPWIVPPSLSADQLHQSFDLISKCESDPLIFLDGQKAADLIQRKSAGYSARKRALDDEEEEDGEENFLFEPGGPTLLKTDNSQVTKKRRKLRRKVVTSDEEDHVPTDEQIEARNAARLQNELERNRKIKSELFVHDSDDETDEERDRAFFEQEERIRQLRNRPLPEIH